ncbi:MAG: hypothetical protein V1839_03965 [archaeon]
MAKANIETKQGTKIAIEGSAEEVAAIVSSVQSREKLIEVRKEFVKEVAHRKRARSSALVDMILEMKANTFFNKPQSITEVKNALAEKAHFYPLPTVSTTLIRLVRRGELGRIKDDGIWKYAKR